MTSIVVISAGNSVPSSTRILADSLGTATQRRSRPTSARTPQVPCHRAARARAPPDRQRPHRLPHRRPRRCRTPGGRGRRGHRGQPGLHRLLLRPLQDVLRRPRGRHPRGQAGPDRRHRRHQAPLAGARVRDAPALRLPEGRRGTHRRLRRQLRLRLHVGTAGPLSRRIDRAAGELADKVLRRGTTLPGPVREPHSVRGSSATTRSDQRGAGPMAGSGSGMSCSPGCPLSGDRVEARAVVPHSLHLPGELVGGSEGGWEQHLYLAEGRCEGVDQRPAPRCELPAAPGADRARFCRTSGRRSRPTTARRCCVECHGYGRAHPPGAADRGRRAATSATTTAIAVSTTRCASAWARCVRPPKATECPTSCSTSPSWSGSPSPTDARRLGSLTCLTTSNRATAWSIRLAGPWAASSGRAGSPPRSPGTGMTGPRCGGRRGRPAGAGGWSSATLGGRVAGVARAQPATARRMARVNLVAAAPFVVGGSLFALGRSLAQFGGRPASRRHRLSRRWPSSSVSGATPRCCRRPTRPRTSMRAGRSARHAGAGGSRGPTTSAG